MIFCNIEHKQKSNAAGYHEGVNVLMHAITFIAAVGAVKSAVTNPSFRNALHSQVAAEFLHTAASAKSTDQNAYNAYTLVFRLRKVQRYKRNPVDRIKKG